MGRVLGAALAVVVVTGCAAPGVVDKAKGYEHRQEWLKAVVAYRQAREQNPSDVEIVSLLKQSELRAAEYHYQAGMSAVAQNDYNEAIGQFELGLLAMPGHDKLKLAMETAVQRQRVERLSAEARRNLKIGEREAARALLVKAYKIEPGNTSVQALIRQAAQPAEPEVEMSWLDSDKTITLNFKETDLRTAFKFLAEAFDVNVIFDSELKERPITLYAKDITFNQALKLMLSTSKTFYKKVGTNTIILAADAKDKRGQYEDYLVRTFHLTHARAKDVADLLKGVLSLQKVAVNDSLNTLTLRDRGRVLELAAQLIRANDRKVAEVLLEVEILEINKTKAEQLGFDYGSVLSLEFPSYPIADSLSGVLRQGTMSLPTVTFRYFKQNTDAKTLANPKIRVLDSMEAKIHIGDRVPLRSATIQEATGQTRTTYEYTDIGIRLMVQPKVNLDNSTLVKMGLEVSSLGQNLGTTNDPAFSIGTRNADTFMLLRDGETAILGGLIRDDERTTRLEVPGLGQIPVVGSLFSSYDESVQRTDVLLTITPKVIRPWGLAPEQTRVLYSGRETHYSNRPQFDTSDRKEELATKAKHVSRFGKVGRSTNRAGRLKFAEKQYAVRVGDRFQIELSVGDFGPENLLDLRFSDELLELVHVDGAQAVETAPSSEVGLALPKEHGDTIKLEFTALKDGISYMLVRSGGMEVGNNNGTAGTYVVIQED
ncbi:secretin N-terminal domain-containing protein [Thiohalomonas denitrificans]|uniref:secretin N-terminal domain-containing protein n=1 Tax=Thiohalomonas denitrificans TaxID=415747 RepID=UPI0026EA5C5A|nr:secretin N-terminal domain-containing protein [Thiohalomonas denitrificans]